MTRAMAGLVGRTAELQELGEGLEAVLAGSGRLFVLTGEPGIGKTRLADELASRARDRGFVVCWGRCAETGAAPAFWPWIQIFRVLLRDAETAETAAAYAGVIARISPERRDDDGDAHDLDRAQARFRLFDELTAFVRAVAERAPVMLVVDDLHAADPSSLALLRWIARELRQVRALVVATCRDRETGAEPAVAAAIREVCREGASLVLRRLDVDEVGALLARRAGGEVPRPLAIRVHAATDGNPLFIDQVGRLLIARHGSTDPDGELPIPAGLRDTIRHRLDALDPSARGVLEALAVLGRVATVAMLASVSGSDEPVTAAALRKGIDSGLVQEVALGRYELCHALFRETLERGSTSARRAELHARAADALEAAAGSDDVRAEAARHLLAAVPVVGPERAHQACLRAARRALDALAFEDAASLLALGAERLGDSIDARARAETLVLLGEARARAGEPDLARRACEEAALIAGELGDSVLLARAALALGAELRPGRVSTSLVALLERARDALPPESSPLRARVLARLAAARQPSPTPEVPIAMAREAVAMARAIGDRATLRTVLHDAGAALVDFGDPAERLGWDTELLDLSEHDGDPSSVLRAHVRSFFDHLELGSVPDADRHLAAHGEAADRLGMPEHQWRTLAMRTLWALWEGRFDDVETHRAQARRIAARSRIVEAPIVELVQAIGTAIARGEALPPTHEVAALTRGFPASDQVELAFRAYELGWRGELDEARAVVARMHAGSVFFEALHPGIRFLADVAAWTEDRALAERLFRLASPLARRLFSWGRIGMVCEGPMTWLLGSLATTMGRLDEAEVYLDDALARTRAMGMRPYEVHARLAQARLYAARGAGAAAQLASTVERGVALAESMGLSAQVQRFAAFGSLPRAPSRGPAAAAPSPTPIERNPRRDESDRSSTVTMAQDGELWALTHGGRTLRLKDSRGMRLLARLVASPGRELHVLSLMGSDGADPGDGGEVLDPRARAAYRARAERLRDELHEAESFGDLGRTARLREELDRLGDELAAAVGLGGRGRRAGGAAEKARINVQKRLRDAIRRVADHDAALGRHLERSVRTGTFCAYEPE
ncbi:MAG: AAA family ATPase [Deltaproteobacteria bacterium]|nr:AAA family ATPase [Deltaproteobacteria bacterium]